jgi:hypothetical protein
MEVKGAAQAGIQSCTNEWVPAVAEKRPSHGKKVLGGTTNRS